MRALLVSLIVVLAWAAQASANGYEVYPYPLAWSADSSLLAVVLPVDFSGSATGGPLLIYDRYGRELRRLEDGVYSSPAFHPADGRLAIVESGTLNILDAADGMETASFEEDVLDCAWLKRGEDYALIYTAGARFGWSDIYLLEPDGTQVNISQLAGEASATGLAPSPGGEYILFSRMPGDVGLFGYERLWVYHTANGELSKAAPEQARQWDYHESNAVFGADDWAIFQRGGWGDWHLCRLELATGRDYLELTDAQQPSISADGHYLGFTRRDYAVKEQVEYDWEIPPAVWVMDRETRVARRVSSPGVPAEYPAVSPDGTRLAWIETTADGQLEVVIRGIAGLLVRPE